MIVTSVGGTSFTDLLMIDLVPFVQNILQPSFVGFFDVAGHRHLHTKPKP